MSTFILACNMLDTMLTAYGMHLSTMSLLVHCLPCITALFKLRSTVHLGVKRKRQ